MTQSDPSLLNFQMRIFLKITDGNEQNLRIGLELGVMHSNQFIYIKAACDIPNDELQRKNEYNITYKKGLVHNVMHNINMIQHIIRTENWHYTEVICFRFRI